jgi:hypothetical protein
MKRLTEGAAGCNEFVLNGGIAVSIAELEGWMDGFGGSLVWQKKH